MKPKFNVHNDILKLRKWLIYLIMALLFLSACSTSTSSPQSVKIIMSMPADLEFAQSFINAAQLAVDEANGQAGGINVELVVLNSTEGDHISHEAEIANAKQAIDDPTVVAYVVPLGSGDAKAVIPLLNEASITQLSATNTWPGLTKPGYSPGEPGIYYPTGTRNYFRTVPSDEQQGIAAAQWAADLGYKTVHLIYSDNVFGEGVAGVFEITAKDRDLVVVGKTTFDADSELSADHLTTLAQKVLDTNPDVVHIGGGFAGNGEYITRALREANPDIPLIVVGDLVLDELITFMGTDNAENIYGTTVGLPIEQLGEPAADFSENFEAAYGSFPSPFDAAMYEAVNVILHAISRADRVTREGVLQEMHSLEAYNGIFGSWHFNSQGDISFTAISGMQIQNGSWEFVESLRQSK